MPKFTITRSWYDSQNNVFYKGSPEFPVEIELTGKFADKAADWMIPVGETKAATAEPLKPHYAQGRQIAAKEFGPASPKPAPSGRVLG